ncbi:MAG TPA: CPBP family intramembrane glutamic endopeptidase, partial [Candidatus Acidoferrum sp.]|nr:CPBP family intramembrane glutamic endopeptidase [Candidatus Acidoferrum sp.]
MLFGWLTRTPLRNFGLVITHPLRDLLVAIPFGLAAFTVAAAFAAYLSRRSGRWFVPTKPDLLVQSAYYLLLNAPIEEWFFRGFLQGELARWWNAPVLALLVATVVFGGYHFLDRWGWRPVAGATAAGLTLGLIYLLQPSPASLLAPVLV